MRPSPIAITLAGEDYKIRPLTLRQLQEIEAAFQRPRETFGAGFELICLVISAALSRDYPDAAALAASMELEALDHELPPAYAAILELGGFKLAATPGEAPAAVPPSGEGSTAA